MLSSFRSRNRLKFAYCNNSFDVNQTIDLTNELINLVNPDPEYDFCKKHKYFILNDESRNFEKSVEGSLCDKEISDANTDWKGEAWYRIMPPAGTRLYNKSISQGKKCGSLGNGWLTTRHPQIKGSTLLGKVCFGFAHSSCISNQEIKIKNCGFYFLYYLKKPPSACPDRYCTE